MAASAFVLFCREKKKNHKPEVRRQVIFLQQQQTVLPFSPSYPPLSLSLSDMDALPEEKTEVM